MYGYAVLHIHFSEHAIICQIIKKCSLKQHTVSKIDQTIRWSIKIDQTFRRSIGSNEILLNMQLSGLILALRPANERRSYFVTAFLIGGAQA